MSLGKTFIKILLNFKKSKTMEKYRKIRKGKTNTYLSSFVFVSVNISSFVMGRLGVNYG